MMGKQDSSDAIDIQLLGALEKIFHAHIFRRGFLIGVNFAEKPVVAITIDPYFHVLPPEKELLVRVGFQETWIALFI
jgi:hypothetical protein